MHWQVALPLQASGTFTQCAERLVSPPCRSSCTQIAFDCMHSAQLGTPLHCVTSTHGPQHAPTTLGTRPGGHTGGIEKHADFIGSHSKPATQRPAAQRACLIPAAEHESMAQAMSQP